jgi:hypothetical protein
MSCTRENLRAANPGRRIRAIPLGDFQPGAQEVVRTEKSAQAIKFIPDCQRTLQATGSGL